MNIFHKLTFAILTISFLTFVALFGRLPALRKTPVGALQRLLCLRLPSSLRHLDNLLTGGALSLRTQRLGQYLFFEKNPIVLILFLALLTTSSILFLRSALPLLPASRLLPIPPLLLAPYLFTYLTASHRGHLLFSPSSSPSSPSTSSDNSARMRDYPFDRTLFHPRAWCRTCARPKPARSKHCSLCGACVARADHHCPWFDNCVGRGNYVYFLATLLSVGALEVYGAWLAWGLVGPAMPWAAETAFPAAAVTGGAEGRGLFTSAGTFLGNVQGGIVAAVDAGGFGIAGVGALAAFTAPLPLALLGYHLYLVWAGMTTNEAAKWGEWKEDVADGIVFRASRGALREHLRRRGKGARVGVYAWEEGWNPALDGLGSLDDGGQEEGGDVVVPWPVRSDQVLVRTSDGRPPTGQEELWTRVRSMREVDNIYDLGWRRNFVEVLKGR